MDYKILLALYSKDKKSVSQIAKSLKCSQGKVNYWLRRFKIEKRSISDAIYNLKNPQGNPFAFQEPKTINEALLYGLGIGLYWGEGAKRGNGGVRLANTDARLIRKFIEFLEKVFQVKKDSLRFGLQIFGDISSKNALMYWKNELGIKNHQFYKIMVSKIRGEGTYKYKSEYGVLMLYFNNVRLKQLLCQMIDNIR